MKYSSVISVQQMAEKGEKKTFIYNILLCNFSQVVLFGILEGKLKHVLAKMLCTPSENHVVKQHKLFFKKFIVFFKNYYNGVAIVTQSV